MNNSDPFPNNNSGQQAPNQAAQITGILGIVFGGIATAWALLGGACCGWITIPLALVALALAIVSVALQRTPIGWTALGLSIFGLLWPFIVAALFMRATTGAI